MTQLERADAIRADFLKMFPEIDRLSRDLSIVLDEAQNAPPDGAADGTVSEVQYAQLHSIQKAAGKLILSLLFNSRER